MSREFIGSRTRSGWMVQFKYLVSDFNQSATGEEDTWNKIRKGRVAVTELKL
jgi:hypothetical protein